MSLIESAARAASPLLNLPVIRRVRRNHGLEHATIHILAGDYAERKLQLRVAGRSHDRGFLIYGDIDTADLEHAIREALRRMRAGEHNLAVHPNCGTNLVTTGLMTTVAAMLGTAGANRGFMDRLSRLPTVMLLVIFATLFARPVGMSLQKHFTTLGDPGDLEYTGIERTEANLPFSGGKMVVHRVQTTQG